MNDLGWMRRHPVAVTALVAFVLVGVLIAGICVGAVQVPPRAVLAVLMNSDTSDPTAAMQQAIIWDIRLPRVLMTVMVGAVLALAGTYMQAFFGNPLADPALIGISSGGALGAVSVIVLGAAVLPILQGAFALPIAAFLGGIIACAVVYSLARQEGGVDATTMLLCGIAVNALAGAGIGYLSFLADDAQLRDLTFWSLGSFGMAGWSQVALMVPAAVLMLALAPLAAGFLNALLLGEAEARSLGYGVEAWKVTLLLCVCIGAGTAVATCGVIGFVGLIAPHAARLAVGPDHRRMMPLAILLGAILLLGADLFARIAVSPSELPIGVVTALVGGPMFLALIRKQRRKMRYA